MGIDLVFDDVEKELLRERELILGIKDQLEDLFDKVVLQIRKLRVFAYDLGNDLNCKQNTLRIETHNKKLDKNNVEKSILNNKTVFEPAYVFLFLFFYWCIQICGWCLLLYASLFFQ